MPVVEVKQYSLSQFNEREILRYCGAKTVDSEFLSLLKACQTEAQENLSPRVCYGEFPLSINGETCDFQAFTLSSKHLAKNLQGCKKAVVFVATVGVDMDRLIIKYGKISPVKALCMQAIGSERAEALANEFCKDLRKKYAVVRPRFSPGYGDLALETQKSLFEALNPCKNIGVSLTDTLLMTPCKSISAFVGVEE